MSGVLVSGTFVEVRQNKGRVLARRPRQTQLHSHYTPGGRAGDCLLLQFMQVDENPSLFNGGKTAIKWLKVRERSLIMPDVTKRGRGWWTEIYSS